MILYILSDQATTTKTKVSIMSSTSCHSTIVLDPNAPSPAGDASRNPFASNNHGESFNKKVEEALRHWRVPGLALAIVDHHTVISHGYGSSRVGSDAPDVTPATIFDIASMSKSFTASSMALLVQDEEDETLKEVKWETPVSRLDPDLRFKDEEKTRSISVEDILSHRTGLQGHEESVRGVNHPHADTLASVVRNMRNLPFAYPLRTKYEYNNLLYSCAAHLVERLSGSSFPSYLETNFWDKLNMSRTWLGPDNVPSSEAQHMALGSIYSTKKKIMLQLPHIPEPEGFGAGSIQSNVEDVARWIHAQIYRLPPLSSQSYDDLRAPRILQDVPIEGQRGMSPSFYCLGWEVSWYHGYEIVRHDGSWAGFVSIMLYLPEKEWGVVLLGNSEDASPVETEILFHLIDTLLQVPDEKRFDWRAHYDKKMQEWAHVKTKDELFPELDEHKDDEPHEDPALQTLTGKYTNKGYHEIELAFNAGKKQLQVDCSDRSYSFIWVIKERAYGYWYVCENIDPASEEKRTFKCTFEVDGGGQAKKFGVDLYAETGDLIWFDKVEA
ncbi:uncharacterized protein N0V89_002797 [Didymosphaeria variabile]|uniref:Beta-lactamase-related domain-containing protein n=1 Tax=Didymosphaeria variabile TaxID=1932322 RepID=A0A9W8XVG2_9PLEO|nr:uncharacterized protein N0V89_002797 [Didymosphaeria variabile]KAJ4358217.1 hypothetical protein N0V89_002797 [Didymosphaeria variabile]